MSFTPATIPRVDPMMVRKFTPDGGAHLTFGGVFCMDHFNIEDVGLAQERFDFDEAVVDCSNRIFEITNFMLMNNFKMLCCFSMRRWRNLRERCESTGPHWRSESEGPRAIRPPDAENPLLYIGNPIRLTRDESGELTVWRSPEFRIKSGMELGY